MTLPDSFTSKHSAAGFEAEHSLLSPTEIIEAMIDLRIQSKAIEARIEQLMPAFKTACASFARERIELERAIISKRLTPGQWNYSASILEQEAVLKQLKQQFQITHEPSGGREITWTLKLIN